MPESHRRAVLSMVTASILFSTGGAAIKWAHFTGWQIASLRAGIAGLTLLVLVPEARRGWGWRPALVGLAYAVTCICFVLANRLTTSADAIFIQSTSPLYVLVLAPLLIGEKVCRRDVLFMVPVGIGLSLFFLGEPAAAATAPNPRLGNLVAAISGFTMGIAMVGFRWLGRGPLGGQATAITAATIGNLIACTVALPMAWPVGSHATVDWVVLLYLGVFQIGVAYYFVGRGLRRLGALEASVLLLLEPALNPVWSWLVHGEVPGGLALVGGALVLGATVFRAALPEPAAA